MRPSHANKLKADGSSGPSRLPEVSPIAYYTCDPFGISVFFIRWWKHPEMTKFPDFTRSLSPAGETRFSLGHPLVDSYLEFVAGRTRPNTLRAVAFDLKAFFGVVEKDPIDAVEDEDSILDF
jgi:hypothetical protein